MMNNQNLELGIGIFGDLAYDEKTHRYANAGQKLQEIIEEVKLADQLGIDVFALGEHHRPDYAVSSPEMVMAAIATVTEKIKLMSAVTVLSSAEPVKVYQDFSTLDLISKGRAEIGVGRGSFTESFPLFGYDLKDYNELFEEKLSLLLKINNQENVTWRGKLRAPMIDQTVYPRATNNGKLPVWIAVGGTPESVHRAARLGLPLIVAIIGGMPSQFKPLMDYYKQEYLKYGHHPDEMQIGVHSHSFISEDPEVIEGYFKNYAGQMNRIGQSRGWAPYTKMQYDGGRSADGALFIGNSEEVAEKINTVKEMFGITRFIGHMDIGSPSHEMMKESIRLFATKVSEKVRS
jgi:probable LLM family oxidoreductase